MSFITGWIRTPQKKGGGGGKGQLTGWNNSPWRIQPSVIHPVIKKLGPAVPDAAAVFHVKVARPVVEKDACKVNVSFYLLGGWGNCERNAL